MVLAGAAALAALLCPLLRCASVRPLLGLLPIGLLPPGSSAGAAGALDPGPPFPQAAPLLALANQALTALAGTAAVVAALAVVTASRVLPRCLGAARRVLQPGHPAARLARAAVAGLALAALDVWLGAAGPRAAAAALAVHGLALARGVRGLVACVRVVAWVAGGDLLAALSLPRGLAVEAGAGPRGFSAV